MPSLNRHHATVHCASPCIQAERSREEAAACSPQPIEASRPYLEPGLEPLQLLDGSQAASIHIAGQQAAVVVGKAHEGLVHALQGQLLAPPLAGLPVASLAVAVHLRPHASVPGFCFLSCCRVGNKRTPPTPNLDLVTAAQTLLPEMRHPIRSSPRTSHCSFAAAADAGELHPCC